jgi:ACS family hexuronate transporter-like MFS transporter
MSSSGGARSPQWKWYVCGILLLATMLNYMDRQTLANTITDISKELGLNNEQYGQLEFGFGMAFAAGGILVGFLVDRLSVRWMYPLVLIGWSSAGIATAYAAQIGQWLQSLGFGVDDPPGYVGLMACRITLGLFEAGQWPCALVTSQRLLSAEDRPLGNSLLQSGAALGAIITPLIVQQLVSDQPGSWRLPFQAIGLLGMLWIIPWLSMVRESDLRPHGEAASLPNSQPKAAAAPAIASENPYQAPTTDAELSAAATSSAAKFQSSAANAQPGADNNWPLFIQRFLVLALTVVVINLCFHFFRAWLPKFLREYHGYERSTVNYFTSAYFIATDVGCLSIGVLVKRMTLGGWPVHRARMATFGLCAALTALSTVASQLPAEPPLLGVLLVIGFGALGLFPNYYSLTQDLSPRHQGKVTGSLGCITWVCTAWMQKLVGQSVDATGSYARGIFVIGLLPLVAFAALALFWNWPWSNSEVGIRRSKV